MTNELKIGVMREGDGDVADNGQHVTVNYEERLPDDTVSDAGKLGGRIIGFALGAGQVSKEWEQGVAGMKVGEIRRLIIPADHGYGVSGTSNVIPTHACSVFDIELLGVTETVTLGHATPAELLRAQKRGVIVVDIRRPEEWVQTGVIAGAETITAFEANGSLHPDFQQKFMRLVPTPSTPVLLYCLMGARTTNIGTALVEQLGFLHVTHLSGGILGWTTDGYKTVDYKP